MIMRSLSLFLLAANATAFVMKPASFMTRSSGVYFPIPSSLSADPETNQEVGEESDVQSVVESPEVVDESPAVVDESPEVVDESPEVVGEVESVSTDDETPVADADSASDGDDKAKSLSVGQTKRNTIYVGNLPYSTSVKEIKELFLEHAEVRYVNLPRNRETGNIKGFAFVDVASEEDIPAIVDSLNGMELGGRPLRVSRSLEKDQIKGGSSKPTDDKGKLYIGNIPFTSTKEDLLSYFGEYAEIKDVFIPVDKYAEPRGFAFITVVDAETVDAVIEATNRVEFMGRTISVNRPLPPGEKPQKRAERVNRMKIFVGNLSFYTSDEMLVEVFEEFGEVYDCYIPREPDSNNSRGFGFVTMFRDAGNEAVDALNGCELDGREISVNEARPRFDKKEEEKSGDEEF